MRYTSRRYLERQIRRKAGQAIHDYGMVGDGDRVIVAVSGGKDSIVLMKILAILKKAAPVAFELFPVHIRTGYETGIETVADWMKEELGCELLIRDSGISQIMSLVAEPEKSPCALCSRLRRGILYGMAGAMGAASVALGHHMDDIIETFLLRSFYTGQLGAMAPARVADDGKNRVIRPLAYCTTELIEAYFPHLEIEPVTVTCPIRRDSKRGLIRGYIKQLERDIPCLKHSIFASLGNIDTRSLCVKENIHADPD